MTTTEISESFLESIAPPGMMDEARNLLETESFGGIITRDFPLAVIGECGQRHAGFALDQRGEMHNACACRGGGAAEKQPCAHSVAVVLEFYRRSRDLGEDLDDPRNHLSRRLLLPPDFFETWGMAVLEVSWQLARLRMIQLLPEESPDRQLLALTHPSGDQRVHCSTMSSVFRMFHNSDLLYLKTPDGVPERIKVREKPLGLRLRLSKGEGDSDSIELEPSTGFGDGKLLVTPVPDDRKMDREHDGHPFGWIYRTDARELLCLPDTEDLNLCPDYDEILEAALTGKKVSRPSAWLAAYRQGLRQLFRFDEEDEKLIESLGDGSSYRPDIAEGSPQPSIRQYSFAATRKRYWGKLPVKQVRELLEPMGFVLRGDFDFVQCGKHSDIYRGFSLAPNDGHQVKLSIWISVTSHAGQWSFGRPLFAEERGRFIYHAVDSDASRAELMERSVGSLGDRLEELENDRALELLSIAKPAIEVTNRCLARLTEMLDAHPEDPDGLLKQITPEARNLVDNALSYRVVKEVYMHDHPYRVLLDFAATLLCRELPDEEIAADIDSGAMAHTAVMILADRIEHFADDRVVPLVERAYLMSNLPAEDKPKQKKRKPKSASCDGVTFFRNTDGDRERIGGTLGHYRLKDHLTAKSPKLVKQLSRDGLEAIWVQGRLLQLFGGRYVSEEKRGSEKTIVDTDMVAQLESAETVEFNCCDSYGKSSLLFASGEDPQVYDKVANAFWRLLLSEPQAVKNFKGKIEHTGALCTLRFAISDGEVRFGEGAPSQMKTLGQL